MHTDNKQLASLLFTHDPSQSRKERGRGGHKAERGGAFVMDMNLLSVIFAVKLGNISFRPAGTLCRGGWRFLLYDCRNSETITPHLSEIGHAEEWGAAHLWPLGGKERGRDRGQFNFLTFPPKQSFLCKSKEYFSPPWDFYKQKTKREKAGGVNYERRGGGGQDLEFSQSWGVNWSRTSAVGSAAEAEAVFPAEDGLSEDWRADGTNRLFRLFYLELLRKGKSFRM